MQGSFRDESAELQQVGDYFAVDGLLDVSVEAGCLELLLDIA